MQKLEQRFNGSILFNINGGRESKFCLQRPIRMPIIRNIQLVIQMSHVSRLNRSIQPHLLIASQIQHACQMHCGILTGRKKIYIYDKQDVN